MKKFRSMTALLMVLTLLATVCSTGLPFNTAKASTQPDAGISSIELEIYQSTYYIGKDKNNLYWGANTDWAEVWIDEDDDDDDFDDFAQDVSIEWSTSDPSIVKFLRFENDGEMCQFRVLKTGKATISVKVTDNDGTVFTESKTITVKKTNKKIKKLAYDGKGDPTVRLKVGKSEYISNVVTYKPISAFYNKLTATSSNKKVAVIKKDADKRLMVVGKKKGTATITVKSSNGKKISFKVKVK